MYDTEAGIRNIGMVAMNFMVAPTKPVGINSAIKSVVIIDTGNATDKP